MDSTLARLTEWMPRQRWYATKGRTPSLRLVGSWDLPSDADARITTHLVSDEASTPEVLYQVPLVARSTPAEEPDGDHAIGRDETGRTLIDGPFDPAYCAALFALVTRGGEHHGAGTVARGAPAASAPRTDEHPTAAVLRGEQSNTSIIFESDGGGSPVICKLFRQVQPGLNPDIELQTALADAGSPYVPRAIGWVAGEWPDESPGAGALSGSLAFAQEFLPGVQDAWRVALASAGAAADFTARARDLGVATAGVHLSLSQLLPTRAASGNDRAAITASWQQRLDAAVTEVPEMGHHRSAVEAIYARASDVPWPPLQRIHGDFHLGQVIHVDDRGWVLLDFEGEPLRPMSERVEPDLALRDVAGMLRSFDYVAGSLALTESAGSHGAVAQWAADARSAFVAGYEDASGGAATGPLLDALELDKAVYEAVYETRNRPSWTAIPLGGIERLCRAQGAH